MKFKKSSILLIAMAIFLLISIGSVCASENTTADSDVQLANTNGDIVLADDDYNSALSDDGQGKINTTVDAQPDKDKFSKDENKTIQVTVKDNESEAITNITKSNLTVTENNKNVSFEFNNSKITIKENLTVGEHNLRISYLGNNLYNSSYVELKLKIFTDNYLEVPESVDYNGTRMEIPIKLTDGIDDHTGLLNKTNTNITSNGTALTEWSIEGNKLIINSFQTTIPATLTINYTESGKSLVKNIALKYGTTVNFNTTEVNITEGANALILVNVTVANGTALNITASDITNAGARGTTVRFNATTGVLTIENPKSGVYNIRITYKGNATYNTSFNNVTVNVRGTPVINTNGTSINVNSTKKGTVQIINITNGVDTFDFDQSNINLTLSYKDGNVTRNVTVTLNEIVNGTIKFSLDNLNFTTATLTIAYNGTTAVKNITVNRIYNVNITAINTVNDYQNGNFTFKLIDIDDPDTPVANQKITLYTVGNIRAGFSATTDENGTATFKTVNLYEFDQSSSTLAMKELQVGNHSVELSTEGAVKSTTLKINLTINQATINIVIDPYKEYYGSDKNVTIHVTNSKNGEAVSGIILKLDMPQTSGKIYYIQTDSNGVGKISAKNLIGGDYDLTVSNNDTKNIANASAKATVTVLKIPVTISTNDVTIYYNSGTTATIKVTNNGKAVSGMYLLVKLYTTSTKYDTYLFQTNSKGQVAFSADLAVGKHKIVVSSADNRYTARDVTKTITVKKASAKITAKKVTAYYKQGKYFTIKLTNTKNKKAIYAAKLNIKIYTSKNRYYNYNGKTGTNGQIKILINLKPGTYKVVVSGADSKDFSAKQVTSKIVVKKAPTKFTLKNYKAKKYFTVKVTNKKTKKVIPGVKVKVKVYTGKKVKTYTKKTTSKGLVKLSTKSLKSGKHKVVVTSANKYCVAKKLTKKIKTKR